jgi:sulfur transfer protein SufE
MHDGKYPICGECQVPDPKLKYQQLLAYGKKLPPMPAEDHTEDNKVRGCVSQVSPGWHIIRDLDHGASNLSSSGHRA